jgi:hypothetical protein
VARHHGGVRIRLVAFDLPGRDCGAAPGFPGYTNIHVGVQRRGRPGELLDPQPADADHATWTLECVTAETPDGLDLRGPHVQGGPGGRFVYLSWVTVADDGTATLFRRAKLMWADVDQDTARAAAASGTLVGRLGLTDRKGHPLCARVRPPLVVWSAE